MHFDDWSVCLCVCVWMGALALDCNRMIARTVNENHLHRMCGPRGILRSAKNNHLKSYAENGTCVRD